MELLWLYYNGLKAPRYILFLQLGVHESKMCGLDVQKVCDGERKKIIIGVSKLSLGSAIDWIRNHCPLAYKSAYRQLAIDRVQVISRHKIDSSRVV